MNKKPQAPSELPQNSGGYIARRISTSFGLSVITPRPLHLSHVYSPLGSPVHLPDHPVLNMSSLHGHLTALLVFLKPQTIIRYSSRRPSSQTPPFPTQLPNSFYYHNLKITPPKCDHSSLTRAHPSTLWVFPSRTLSGFTDLCVQLSNSCLYSVVSETPQPLTMAKIKLLISPSDHLSYLP